MCCCGSFAGERNLPKTSGRRDPGRFWRGLALAPFLLFTLFPFYWMLVTSLKVNRELYDLAAIPLLIRQGITLEHYAFLFRQTEFLTWFENSVIVCTGATAISLAISIVAAYGLTRLRFHGADLLAMGIFISYLVPSTLLFIPLADMVARVGLTDSLWSLTLTYPSFLIPFCTWLLMGYFRTLPREVEECAMVDGLSRFMTLIRIVLPVAKPGIVTAALFSFTLSWGELVYGLTFISSSTEKPLAVGVVAELVRGDVFYWGSLMAGALLASVPVVVVYALFTDQFVGGLTAGAMK
jgi:multiple sugar transport system permease protein